MKAINNKKSSILKKILIKICRLLGYELIDQGTLEFPVSNKKIGIQLVFQEKNQFL